MDLAKNTVTELKAMVYDQMAASQACQSNIRAIENELAKRADNKDEVDIPTT